MTTIEKQENTKCEGGGCRQIAEFLNPRGEGVCSDCAKGDVETFEYSWHECEAI